MIVMPCSPSFGFALVSQLIFIDFCRIATQMFALVQMVICSPDSFLHISMYLFLYVYSYIYIYIYIYICVYAIALIHTQE